MCFTCCANVRTVLNSPWVGAKLNLSSGMASAAGTTSCSTLLSERSSTIAKLGFWSGLACMAACGFAATAVPIGASASNKIPIATCLFIEKASTEMLYVKVLAEGRDEDSNSLPRHWGGFRPNAAGTRRWPAYQLPSQWRRRTANAPCPPARQFPPREQPRLPVRPAKPAGTSKSPGRDWPGFLPGDCGNVAGTTWRRRRDQAALVPLLLRPLQEVDADFTSYPIYRLPHVHLALRERYEQGAEHEQGWRASKLIVYASGDGNGVNPHVAVGFYVEKGTGADKFGPIDRALWDWPRFLDVLEDPRRRESLERALELHPLTIGSYIGTSFDGTTGVGFLAQMEDGELVMRTKAAPDEVCGRGLDDLAAYLRALPAGEWHDLHIWREWPAQEAEDGAQPFAVEEMRPVLLDLADVYLAVVGPA